MATTHRKTVALIALAIGLMLSSGQFFSVGARIGETQAEVASPERYGDPVEKLPATLIRSQGSADVFEVDKLKIRTEFAEDGKVWRISYQRKDLQESLMSELLQRNGGKREWSKPAIFSENKHWTTTDREMHAVYYGNPVYKLVIMTRTALEAERVPKSLTIIESKTPARESDPRDLGDPLKRL